MLRQEQAYLLLRGNYGFMLTLDKRTEFSDGSGIYRVSSKTATKCFNASPEETTEPDEHETQLDDAAQSEREYVRQRLREELGREPTESELDEWLRQHTEGY
jgi:hypothetical protein